MIINYQLSIVLVIAFTSFTAEFIAFNFFFLYS